MHTLEYYTYYLRAYGYVPRYRPSVNHSVASPQAAVTTGLVQELTDRKKHTSPADSASSNQTKVEKKKKDNLNLVRSTNAVTQNTHG